MKYTVDLSGLPQRPATEEPLTEKQVQFIQNLNPKLKEHEIRALGKWQAASLIKDLLAQEKEAESFDQFNDDLAEYSLPGHHQNGARWPAFAVLVIVAMFAGSFVLISHETPCEKVPTEGALPSEITSDAAQKEAVRLYPQLGIKASNFNRRFIARVVQYRQENSAFFTDQNWPVTLAKLIAGDDLLPEKPAAPAPPPPPSTHAAQARPARVISYVPGLGRYIEHDRTVSAMQSLGGGDYGPASSPPQSASQRAANEMGFGQTALDRKPQR